MQVLNSYAITTFIYQWGLISTLGLCIIIAGGAYGMLQILSDKKPKWAYLILFIGLGITIGSLYIHGYNKTTTYKEVAFPFKVDIIEFYNEYEVIEQRGDILVITEREDNNG